MRFDRLPLGEQEGARRIGGELNGHVLEVVSPSDPANTRTYFMSVIAALSVDPLPLKLRADWRTQHQLVAIEPYRARFNAATHVSLGTEFHVVDGLAIAYLTRSAVGVEAQRIGLRWLKQHEAAPLS
jgi:hypothetical protein